MAVAPVDAPYIPAKYQGAKQTPTLSVIHSTVGPTKAGSARAIARYGQNPSSPSSWHYAIDTAEVIQSVHDHTVAYHCGFNSDSLAYEMCDNPSRLTAIRWLGRDHKAMLDRTARTVARNHAAYGIPVRFLTDDQLRAWNANGRKAKDGGITTHAQMSRVFKRSTHWDPGKWPADKFLTLVKKYHAALTAPPSPPATTHTRWAIRETGVHKTPGGTLVRKIPAGYSFRVIDGSGSGMNGWVQTSAGNWVLGADATIWDPALPVRFSVADWNVENKGDADAALDRAEVIKLCADRKPTYFCLQEVYRVDLSDIPGYQTYQASEGYSVDSENRAQAILIRDDVALKIMQALQMEEEWTGPKMGLEKEPRVHRYVTGNFHDLNIPVATMHAPFPDDGDRAPIEETRLAAIEWLKDMKAAHGRGVIVADWNSLADGLQAKVGTPAGATVDGGGLDKAVFVGLKLIKGENLGNRGRSDHPVKVWTFEA